MVKRKTFLTVIGFILLVGFILGIGLLLAFRLSGANPLADFVKNLTVKTQVSAPVDTTPLVVQSNISFFTTYKNYASITFKSNKEVSVQDANRYKLYLALKPTTSDPNYWYVAEIQNLGLGDFALNMPVSDAAGNTQKITAQITRSTYTLPTGLSNIEDWPNSIYYPDGDNLLARVDKLHKLPMDYVPQNLIDIHKDLLLYTNSPSAYLIRDEAGQSLAIMAKALQKEKGKNLVITSAYRSYAEQYQIYATSYRDNGQDETDKVLARPGFSEHQLGTAVDFVDQDSGLDLTNDFDNDVAGTWLRDNSYKYGFIQSYPVGKENETGYNHEAWHYRYIGVDAAKKVHDSGLTLKEWLDQNNPV